MDNQTLQLLIQASAETATNAVNKLKSSIGGLKQYYTDISGEAATFGNVMWKLGKISFAGLVLGMKNLATSLRASIDRAEELNLFNVVFKNMEKNGVKTFSALGQEATKFQNKLNEAFGTNMTDTLRYQALFQSMGENTGISDKYASIMSENLTKLTYDLASLYNTSEQSTAEALKSGIYAGQTKPLRKFGVDVTQGSLSPLLAELGIDDRTISQMSQAEKQILRYIATMKQAQVAMGDFADTIESPANQLKILKNQFAELRVAIGNLFVGLFNQILPYANAVIMVLKELAKAIAGFFGIEVRDYNNGLSALEDTEEAYEGIGDGANKAAKAAEKLNRQTLKFDQLNNIKSPTKSGSGSGGGSTGSLVGGIDKRLLDSIKGYDNLMGKVQMKATQIRDRWMDILGFKKIINPLTGEVSFKYQGFAKTVEGLAKAFNNLSAKGKLLVSLGLATIFGKIYSSVSGLAKSLVATDTSMGKFLTNAGSKITTVVKGIGIATTSFFLMETGLESIAEDGTTVINVLETLAGALGTTFGAAQIGSVFGPWGTAIGAGIGLVTSLITSISGISYALDEEQVALDKAAKKAEEAWDRQKKSAQEAKDAMSLVDSEMSYYENLRKELDDIVDKNGKIKSGYEERAKTITGILSDAFGVEVEIVNGVIKKYDEYKLTLDEVMKKKSAMAKMEMLEDKWKEATQKLATANAELEESYNSLEKMYANQSKVVQNLADTYGISYEKAQEFIEVATNNSSVVEWTDEMRKMADQNGEFAKSVRDARDDYLDYESKINDAQKTWEKHKDIVKDNEETIRLYEKAYGYVMDENYDALDSFLSNEAVAMGKSQAERNVYYQELQDKAVAHKKWLEEHQSEYNEKEYKRLIETDNRIIDYTNSFFDNWKTIYRDGNGEIHDDTVRAWQTMGEESTEECLKEFKRLPKETQDELYEKMLTTGNGISKKLQDGLDSVRISKTVQIKGDSTQLMNVLDKIQKTDAYKKIKEVLKITATTKALGGVFSGGSWKNIPQYANGGSPRHGSLALIGENGPEIVGHVNGRTEVLNRSQIASSIYSAVLSAMSQIPSSGGEVHLYAHTDEGVIIDRINQKTKQTGRCPINIPA